MNRNSFRTDVTPTTQASSFSHFSDEALVLDYQTSRSEAVFAELTRRYERELFSYLRRYLGNAAQAEDAFQATFLTVHQKCHLFESGRRFRPWLYTIATNRAIDLQRRSKRHQLVSLDHPNRNQEEEVGGLIELLTSSDSGADERLELTERVSWLRQAIAALPEQLANTLQLVYFRGLKQREAAQMLAVPVGTVKSRLHAAVQQLGSAWRRDFGG